MLLMFVKDAIRTTSRVCGIVFVLLAFPFLLNRRFVRCVPEADGHPTPHESRSAIYSPKRSKQCGALKFDFGNA
jgi:hypothetical protein